MALLQNTGQTSLGDSVPIPVGGLVSFSPTPLPANGIFSTDILPYNGNDSIHFSIMADQIGTYQVEYYQGQSKIDFVPSPVTFDPSIAMSFQAALAGKGDGFRLIYKNGDVDQSSFYMEVRFSDGAQQTYRSLGVPASGSNMAGTTHAAIEGRVNGRGAYNQVTTTLEDAKVALDVNVINQTGNEAVDTSLLAKDETLKNGAVRVQIVDGNNQNRGTQANPISVNNTNQPNDYAKDAGLTAILNKLISSPATEATVKALLDKLDTSIAVTGTFFQATQPVSGSVNVGNFPTTQALPDGASTSALQSALNSLIGALNNPQATNSTGAWSNIALLKGILQRPSNGVTTSITTTAASSVVLAANANRKGATIFSVSGTILITLGGTSTANAFTARLITNGYYEIPFGYTGAISAMGAGTISVTELT